ncbi:hypothetical protein PENSPDRAFT_588869, partial [Peniophora sp. CONT]
LHALIIGIDRYASPIVDNLRGAGADADAIDEYLRRDLHVPRRQIVNLRNEEATRNAIVDQLQALVTRDTIRKDDPILIYFSGQSGRIVLPGGQEKVSVLVPTDAQPTQSEGEDSRLLVTGFLGVLLCEIAASKGNNITVIIDASHSGSSTNQLGYMQEAIHGSHVLLAACRRDEVARESSNGGGVFTEALLSTLRNISVHKTTYRDLIDFIAFIPEQRPHCEGYYRDRTLFNGRIWSKPRHSVYRVQNDDGKYFLDVGSIHGVAAASLFALYRSPHGFTSCERSLATMVAKTVTATRTDLSVEADSAASAPGLDVSSSFAVRTFDAVSDKPLRLRILPSPRALATMTERTDPWTLPELIGWNLVNDDHAPSDFVVQFIEDRIQCSFGDEPFKTLGVQQLQVFHTLSLMSRDLLPVLRSASHFLRCLHRSAPDSDAFSRRIGVSFHELANAGEQWNVGDALRDGSSSRPRKAWATIGDDMNRGGVVNINADSEKVYGVTISNDSRVPFHVRAFYFDCSDLAIVQCLQSPLYDARHEPMLPAEGELQIGHGGTDSEQPLKFSLRPDQSFSVGFLKLFVSTYWADLPDIEQYSPFETSNYHPSPPGSRAARWGNPELRFSSHRQDARQDPERSNAASRLRGGVFDATRPHLKDIWCAITVAIVQSRSGANSTMEVGSPQSLTIGIV